MYLSLEGGMCQLRGHQKAALIHDQDLPMHLLDEATRTTVYVHNIIPHSALGVKTLEEMFTRNKAGVSHLKIFGCLVFVHIPKEKKNQIRSFRKERNMCWVL